MTLTIVLHSIVVTIQQPNLQKRPQTAKIEKRFSKYGT